MISDGKDQRKKYEKRYPTSVCIHNGESMIMNGDAREMEKKVLRVQMAWNRIMVEKHGGFNKMRTINGR